MLRPQGVASLNPRATVLTRGRARSSAACLTPERLIARAAGSGELSLSDLQVTQRVLSVSGRGDVIVGGRAESLAVWIAGRGDVNAAKLEAGRSVLRRAFESPMLCTAKRA